MMNMLIGWYYDYYLKYGLDESTTPTKILVQSKKFINNQNEEFEEFLTIISSHKFFHQITI